MLHCMWTYRQNLYIFPPIKSDIKDFYNFAKYSVSNNSVPFNFLFILKEMYQGFHKEHSFQHL